MKFLVCEKQDGEGCDYTIGCGMTFYTVEAESIEGAQEEIIWPDGKEEYSSLEGEQSLIEILIIPFDQVFKVDIQPIKNSIRIARQIDANNEKEQSEKAELKRLKDKYNT